MPKPLFAVQYVTNPNDPDLWLTLQDIRDQLPKSQWRHSRVYEDVSVSIDIGLPVSQFWLMPEMDRAYFIAKKRTHSAMEAYDALLREKEMKRQQRQGNKRKK